MLTHAIRHARLYKRGATIQKYLRGYLVYKRYYKRVNHNRIDSNLEYFAEMKN